MINVRVKNNFELHKMFPSKPILNSTKHNLPSYEIQHPERLKHTISCCYVHLKINYSLQDLTFENSRTRKTDAKSFKF